MKLFDRIAVASGALGALFLALIGVLMATHIGARMLGHQIPAVDDFTAWFLAASIFLALPYAMLHGDHIRVTLLLQFLPQKLIRVYGCLATLIGLSLAIWGAWEAANFVYESFWQNEVAQGMLRIPLWLPQLCMPIGLTLLAAMLACRLWRVLRGQQLQEISHG